MTTTIFYNSKIKNEYYENLRSDVELLFELEGFSKLKSLKKDNIKEQNEEQKKAIRALKNKIEKLNLKCKKTLFIDVFLRECEFEKKIKFLDEDFLKIFDFVRVEDMGLAFFLKENLPEIKLEIILENFCHSIEAIKVINEKFKGNLEKVILSSELEVDTVKKLIDEKINLEILLYGNILIFQTPRKLISLKDGKNQKALISSSEIKDHKNLIFEVNQNGNFIFNDTPLNLIDDLSKLKKLGIKNFRIDTRNLKKKGEEEFLKLLIEKKDIKNVSFNLGLNPLFFYKNDSDVLFKNLKRKTFFELPKAEVLSTISGKWGIIWTHKDFSVNDKNSYRSVNNEEFSQINLEVYNLEDKKVTSLKKNKIYYVKWIRKMSVGGVFL